MADNRSKFIRFVQQNFVGKSKDDIVKFLQYVQQGLIFTVRLPRFTGWTKDAAFHDCPHPIPVNLKFPVATRIIKVTASLGTAVGSGFFAPRYYGTTVGAIFDTATTLSQAPTPQFAPRIPANTAIAHQVYESVGGSGADADILVTFQAEPELPVSAQSTPLIEETMRLIPADLRDEWVYAMQILQSGLISVMTRPPFTGWTKNGSAQAITMVANSLEFPMKTEVTYVSAYLGTAPGAGKTFNLEAAGSVNLLTISDTAQFAENTAPGITFNKNSNNSLYVKETTAGAGDALDIIVVSRILPLG